jgi:hypothetical protein
VAKEKRMRTVLTAILFLAACSGTAQSETRYDAYIFQPRDGGPETYAFSGGQRAVALEVRGCGDVRMLPDPSGVASQLSARRDDPDTSVVTVIARGSRTFLGPCEEDERDEAKEPDEDDNLVVIEGASARQMRAIIRSFDAAPRETRQEIITSLGLE